MSGDWGAQTCESWRRRRAGGCRPSAAPEGGGEAAVGREEGGRREGEEEEEGTWEGGRVGIAACGGRRSPGSQRQGEAEPRSGLNGDRALRPRGRRAGTQTATESGSEAGGRRRRRGSTRAAGPRARAALSPRGDDLANTLAHTHSHTHPARAGARGEPSTWRWGSCPSAGGSGGAGAAEAAGAPVQLREERIARGRRHLPGGLQPAPPRPTPTRPRAHPSAGPTPGAVGWLQRETEASERASESGAGSGLRAAGEGKLCCLLRFPGPAPSPFLNVAVLPRPRTRPPTQQAAPRSSSPPGLRSGENFKAPDRRLPAYFPTGDFRSVPRTPFPGEAAGGLAHRGLQPTPSLGTPTLRGFLLRLR